ncbi:MAG: DUF2213 domain-containing protein [Planctomycetaceae bacterium]|jgi:hypothetical protein|nr:DUF2213 domain-containing protein [Planctomycetaceae bacterium]
MPEALSIVWNIEQKPLIRQEELDGRSYIVVPMSMILEGVHAGSQGSIYYSKEELSKTPAMWNMKPVTVQHPFKGDTATDLDVYKKQAIGMIMHAQWKDEKLKAEAWLDKEKIEDKEPLVLEHIETWTPMEVSTGLFADCVVDPGSWQGERYDTVAKNIRADHLAILPNKSGACSIQDGAGLLVNQAQEQNKENGADANLHQENKTQELLGQIVDILKENKMPVTIPNGNNVVTNEIMKVSDLTSVAPPILPATEPETAKSTAMVTKDATEKVAPDSVQFTPPIVTKEEMKQKSPLTIGQKELRNLLQTTLESFLKIDKNTYLYIEDIFDTFVVYTINSSHQKLYKIDYEILQDRTIKYKDTPTEVICRPTYITTNGIILNNDSVDANLLTTIQAAVANEIKKILNENKEKIDEIENGEDEDIENIQSLISLKKYQRGKVPADVQKKIKTLIDLYREAIVNLAKQFYAIKGTDKENDITPAQLKELKTIRDEMIQLQKLITEFTREAITLGVEGLKQPSTSSNVSDTKQLYDSLKSKRRNDTVPSKSKTEIN